MTDINGLNNSVFKDLGLTKEQDAEKNALGQQDFLKLLVAQMSHQNPLEPQENGEFLAQMAQFGTVDGITNMQDQLANLSTALQSNQALQASTLVGRSVFVPASSSTLTENGAISGAVELPHSVGSLRINISNQNGEIVNQIDLGDQPGGLTNFVWDGKNSSGSAMPAGTYNIAATATVNNVPTNFSTFVSANVDSVTLGKDGSGMKLNVAGIGSVSLDEVKQISE